MTSWYRDSRYGRFCSRTPRIYSLAFTSRCYCQHQNIRSSFSLAKCRLCTSKTVNYMT